MPVVRQAFADWSNLGIPVPFTFVLASGLADVRVTWVEKFNESISGKTLWAHDDGMWIIDANIQLAVRHHSGEVLDTRLSVAIETAMVAARKQSKENYHGEHRHLH